MNTVTKWIFIMVNIMSFSGLAQIQIGANLEGEAMDDNFGTYIKLSSDGNVLGVLSLQTSSNVHFYKNNGVDWLLYGTDSEGGHFDGVVASSLDLSYDGNTLAFGGAAAVKVYTYESGIWTQKGTDVPNTANDSSFGAGVCLSNDGNIIAVSSPTYITPSSNGRQLPPPLNQGLVQIFQYESGNWVQIGNSIIGNHNEFSGYSFSLSSDGTKIAISNRNSIRIFEYNSNAWTIIGNEISGVYQEHKNVSLSSDGTIVAVGDPQYSDGIIQRGRVRIYKNVSNNWTQIGGDIMGQTAQEFAGEKVSISSNGNVLAVSFIGNNSNGNDAGQVKIFENVSGTWTQMGSSINGEASGDRFGTALSLSSDASTVAIGTPYNDSNGVDAGQVKVYDLSATLANNTLSLTEFKLFPNPTSNVLYIYSKLPLKKVELYSVLGKKIMELTSDFNAIPIKQLANGLYLVKLQTEYGHVIKKLIKD